MAGSGKTDTSYALLVQNYFPRVIFIESDWFGAKVPFDWANGNDIEYIYQTLSLLIDYNLKRGDENFIITLCMPLLRHYHDFIKYLNKGIPSILFCLKCEKDEVIKRIHKRGRHLVQKQFELDAIESDYEYLDDFISRSRFARQISNTRIAEDEVAAAIIEIIKREGEQMVRPDGE